MKFKIQKWALSLSQCCNGMKCINIYMNVICFISISLVMFFFSLFYHFHCLVCMQFMADDHLNKCVLRMKIESKKEYNAIVCQHLHSQLLIIIRPEFANQIKIITTQNNNNYITWLRWRGRVLNILIGKATATPTSFVSFFFSLSIELECCYFLPSVNRFFLVSNHF